MNDRVTLRLAEEVMRAFSGRLVMDTAEIRKILEGEEELVTRCLDFLVGRDELLIAAGRSPRFYHKDNVIVAVAGALQNGESQSAEEIADALDLPIATTCEALGWLERDGRVTAIHRDDNVSFKKR